MGKYSSNRQRSRSVHSRVRISAVETLESRYLLASVGWDGPGLGTANLTYTIGATPGYLPRASVESAIESALDVWSDVVDVNFTQANVTGLRDSLDFTFRNLDGPGSTLAQAYLPDDVNPAQIAGDIQFDLSERWEVGNAAGNSAFDLIAVAVHEIGHALGLDHLTQRGSIMYPSISPAASFSQLSSTDMQAAKRLYAAEVDRTSPSTPPQRERENDGATTNLQNPVLQRWWWFIRQFRQAWWNFSFGGLERGAAVGRLQAETPAADPSAIAQTNQHNFDFPEDVNHDGTVSPLDALVVINRLGLSEIAVDTFMSDVNGNGQTDPLDALHVINVLNQQSGPHAAAVPVSTVPAQQRIHWLETALASNSAIASIDLARAEETLATLVAGGLPERGDYLLDGHMMRHSLADLKLSLLQLGDALADVGVNRELVVDRLMADLYEAVESGEPMAMRRLLARWLTSNELDPNAPYMALSDDRLGELGQRLVDLGADPEYVDELIKDMRIRIGSGDPMAQLKLRTRVVLLGVEMVELWMRPQATPVTDSRPGRLIP